jgi:hypothetical protein
MVRWCRQFWNYMVFKILKFVVQMISKNIDFSSVVFHYMHTTMKPLKMSCCNKWIHPYPFSFLMPLCQMFVILYCNSPQVSRDNPWNMGQSLVTNLWPSPQELFSSNPVPSNCKQDPQKPSHTCQGAHLKKLTIAILPCD